MTAERAHPAGARDGVAFGAWNPDEPPPAPDNPPTAAPRAGRDTADELREELGRALEAATAVFPGPPPLRILRGDLGWATDELLALPSVRRLLDAEARAQAAEATVQRVRELVKKHDGWERINRDLSFRFATQKARQAENFHLGMAQAQESSARHLRRALDGGAS